MNYTSILKQKSFVCGEWLTGSSEQLEVKNKYTGETIAKVPFGTAEDMEKAITGATKAITTLKSWSQEQRSDALRKLKNALEQQKEKFIDLIIAESGKPRGYAQAEIARCLATLAIASEEAMRFDGEVVPIDFGAGKGRHGYTKKFPVGPIACISPFNFPLNLALHKIAPAIAVGASVVLKPSPFAPLTALAFAGLLKETDLPPGAVNILVCKSEVAQAMITDPRMKMLSFTGSPQVGWHLKSIAGHKKVTLELGGNAAVIVDESSDYNAAAKLVATGTYLYAGQVCISTQRILVADTIYDKFVATLRKEIQEIKCGDPALDGVICGPMINKDHLRRIESWVNEAVTQGAEVLAGGTVLSEANNVYAPTLLTKTKPSMKVVCDEVFAPVGVIEKFRTIDEAIHQVNDSKFGLQCGVFTNRIDVMKKTFTEIEVGGVMINNVPGFRLDNMPYGGVKDSGLGREGIKYAMEDMTETRILIY
ncbi:MAG: aldehyde dehydrogenase family protein [Oligoflexales bacterium]